jgi:hypothetical protein
MKAETVKKQTRQDDIIHDRKDDGWQKDRKWQEGWGMKTKEERGMKEGCKGKMRRKDAKEGCEGRMQRKDEEGRMKKEGWRRKDEEGRTKKEGRRRKDEEGRTKKEERVQVKWGGRLRDGRRERKGKHKINTYPPFIGFFINTERFNSAERNEIALQKKWWEVQGEEGWGSGEEAVEMKR